VQVGARNDSEFTQSQMMIAVEALNQGWYVSIADDGGPKAAFGIILPPQKHYRITLTACSFGSSRRLRDFG
jgi:hypothetical protein